MKVVICDDNLEFLQIFQQELEAHFALRDWTYHCKTFRSGSYLLEYDLTDVHAVFLDIDMPDQNGLIVAKQLRRKYPDLVIVFVTAFIQFAVDGYSVEALRYLLKDRLSIDLPACLDAIREKMFSNNETIQIHTLTTPTKIRLKEIIYIEGTPYRHSIFHTYARACTECIGKLTDFESRLVSKGFIRIQRSYLVNMMHIERLSSYTVTLTSGESLSISRKMYHLVSTEYMKWKGHNI